MVRAITVYYPEQDIDAVAPYPWTFRMTESDTTVECVTLINSYKGFRVGPDWNCRHRIRSIHGCVLRYGFYVDGTVEIGRIENCQIHPHWWSKPSVGGDWQKAVAYTAEHLECFVMARTDWEYITNNFMFSAKIGYKFIRTEKGQFNGHLTGCGADGSQTALWFESLQRMGVLITGGEFVSLAGDDPCQVRVLESVKQGCIRFVNTAFWGLPNRVADLRGSAYVSFNDCYFTNWREGVDDSPLLQVHNGRVQVVNSTFDTHHPAVLLGPDVKHALIQGNCGCNGVQVDDQTGGHAILRDNEAPVTPDAVRKFSITGRPSPDEQES